MPIGGPYNYFTCVWADQGNQKEVAEWGHWWPDENREGPDPWGDPGNSQEMAQWSYGFPTPSVSRQGSLRWGHNVFPTDFGREI